MPVYLFHHIDAGLISNFHSSGKQVQHKCYESLLWIEKVIIGSEEGECGPASTPKCIKGGNAEVETAPTVGITAALLDCALSLPTSIFVAPVLKVKSVMIENASLLPGEAIVREHAKTSRIC